MVKFPCGICQKAVAKRHKAICCDLCNKWILIACNNLDKKTYRNLQSSEISWFCMPCLKKELPFNSISSQHFEKIFRDAPIVPLSLTKNQGFTENVNDFLQEQSKNLLNCQYYNISEFNNMIVNHEKKISLFHLNISSLPYHFQDLNDLLKSLKKGFSIIGITETRLKVNSQPLINIDLNNYNIESTPTESEKGGALLYISSDLNYKIRNDLKICTKELESVN